MTANATQPAPFFDIEPVPLPPVFMQYSEEADHWEDDLESGYGRCFSCSCKGYTKSPKDDGFCGTCGHNFTQHGH